MANFDLTISPAQIEYLLKPGITVTQAYQVTNNSSQNIYLNTELLPFVPQGGNASVIYQNLDPDSDISFSLVNSNLTLNQPFVLAPSSSQQLVLKIKSSSQVQLQDSYYTFFVFQQPHNSNSPQTTGRIGSHILLTLTDEESLNNNGHITNFSVNPKIKDVFFNQLTFKGEVKNNSNHFVKSIGRITLVKGDNLVEELILQPNNILANHYRRINCQDQDPCAIKGPFWPGKYTASLEFSPHLNIPTKSISFFIFPISPILLILSLIASFFIIKYSIKKLTKIFNKKKSL
jgi:hypothetical protein